MAGLSRSLAQPPLAITPTPLLLQAQDQGEGKPLNIGQLSTYPRFGEIDRCFNGASSGASFRSYELPLLAELGVNLLSRLVDVCGVLESYAMGTGWPSDDAEQTLARLLFYLSAINDFLGFVKAVLTKVNPFPEQRSIE